jgi:DNA-binding transcriptional ArsR family regulator
MTDTQQLNTSQGRKDPLSAVLEWDCGTAYDFLLSVHAIFRPKAYGLPAPWAAGVRKRLSPQAQQHLKDFFSPSFALTTYLPIHLVLQMDPPKDVGPFLDYMEAIPDDEFSRRMNVSFWSDSAHARVMNRALAGEQMGDADVEDYRRTIGQSIVSNTPSTAEVRRLFANIADPAATKQRWLAVMREYHSAYFAEEERREKPVLQRMLRQAQELSSTMSVPDLIERLSNGFTISEDIDLQRLVLVPSIWAHPYVVRLELTDSELLVVWGAHPTGYKLVPGESVPDEALFVLRALSDPTRLRLLRLIAAEPRSLQSLAQEVKLSLPTVSHHIRELRSSGLIRLEVAGKGRENKYTVRWPSAQRAFQQLEDFVLPDGDA